MNYACKIPRKQDNKWKTKADKNILYNTKYVAVHVELLVVLSLYSFKIFILFYNSLEMGLFHALAYDYSMPLQKNKYLFQIFILNSLSFLHTEVWGQIVHFCLSYNRNINFFSERKQRRTKSHNFKTEDTQAKEKK